MIQAAAENDVHAIGFATDQREVAPGTVLTSVLEGIDNSMVMMVDMLLKDELEGGMLRPGMADNVFKLGPYDEAVPQEVIDEVEQAQEAISRGELTVEEVLVPSQ
jgi:basic membrane lipoprotein Med (substrate-binding protein (PBP1-ABC) superfamily)